MGQTTAPVPNRAAGFGSTDAFYGGGKAPILPSPLAKNAPSWGGPELITRLCGGNSKLESADGGSRISFGQY
jgi:hypothetical protein